jgi:hypothetical protein
MRLSTRGKITIAALIAALIAAFSVMLFFTQNYWRESQLWGAAEAQTVIRDRARSANSFIDSIGLATHLRYTDTSYGRYADVVEPRLRELGIRHIRDGGNNQEMFDKMNRLAQLGIRSTLVMDLRDNINPGNVVSIVKKVLSAAAAIEGPNEWDVNNVPYNGKGFPENVRDFQTGIFNAMKRDPVTANIPVLAPSMAIPENGVLLGSLRSVLDFGNMHSYAGGNPPGQDLSNRWIPLTQRVSGDRPIIITETGWHTAVNDRNASQRGVSEAVFGKYVPRAYLDYFRRGIARSFIYELMDERAADSQENKFGLVRFDGSVKPGFATLRNMVRILNDSAGGTLGTLNYSLTGSTKNVERLLLQKRSGDYYLVLWLNVASTDRTVTQRIALNLVTPVRQVATYLPSRSDQPIATVTNPQRLTLDVPDAPLIVRLVPR